MKFTVVIVKEAEAGSKAEAEALFQGNEDFLEGKAFVYATAADEEVPHPSQVPGKGNFLHVDAGE